MIWKKIRNYLITFAGGLLSGILAYLVIKNRRGTYDSKAREHIYRTTKPKEIRADKEKEIKKAKKQLESYDKEIIKDKFNKEFKR